MSDRVCIRVFFLLMFGGASCEEINEYPLVSDAANGTAKVHCERALVTKLRKGDASINSLLTTSMG